MTYYGLWLILVLLVTSDAHSSNGETIVWNYVPIAVELGVGQERIISFPAPVKMYRPGALQSLLRHQSIGSRLYLTAIAPFEVTRITVEEMTRGEMYLLDVRAVASAGVSTPLQIERVPEARLPSPDEATQDAPTSVVALTRYAAQSLYGPARLRADLAARIPGVYPVAVPKAVRYALFPGQAVSAQPIAGWRTATHVLTAVVIRNEAERPVTLDIRSLRGHFSHATLQHAPPRLAPNGQPGDTTTAYLIAHTPFTTSTQRVPSMSRIESPRAESAAPHDVEE